MGASTGRQDACSLTCGTSTFEVPHYLNFIARQLHAQTTQSLRRLNIGRHDPLAHLSPVLPSSDLSKITDSDALICIH